MQDLTPDAGLPEGYICLWAGNDIPIGFIPHVDHPKYAHLIQWESRGGYQYIIKVDNLMYIDWIAKHKNIV